jgi:hypothetical protein
MGFTTAIASGAFAIGEQLIDRLFPDPEEKAKAKAQLLKLEQEGELKQLSARMSAITAEAESEDKWTSRARPSFMYVFYVVILSLVLVAPVIGVFHPDQMKLFFENVAMGFKAIPEELWWLFGTGYLGYSGFRSMEKRGGFNKKKPGG